MFRFLERPPRPNPHADRDPLDHPAIKTMTAREVADLPSPFRSLDRHNSGRAART